MDAGREKVHSLNELATLLDGELRGDPHRMITGVAGVERVGAGEITFAEDKDRLQQALASAASAVVVPRSLSAHLPDEPGKPVLLVENARLAFARLLGLYQPVERPAPGVHPTAVIHRRALVGKNVSIGAYVVVEAGARIGDGVVLYPGVYIGPGSQVGNDSILYPHVVVRERCQIGARAIIHAGAVIGSDGFGFVTVNGKHEKIPHIGTVVIEDDVEIGANTTIDRGTTGPTRIGRGTKTDNLVQIGHNCDVGESCLLVAQVGLAGSTHLGHHVTLAGQVGVVGHLTIGDHCIVGGKSVVAGDLPPGSFVSGIPARPHTQEMRVKAATRKVPELLQKVRELERRLAELESRLSEAQREPQPAQPKAKTP